jgi:hypothetical protein
MSSTWDAMIFLQSAYRRTGTDHMAFPDIELADGRSVEQLSHERPLLVQFLRHLG